MTEHSRRHGAFDPRYPVPIGHPPAIPSTEPAVSEGERLGWLDFVATYYPGSHRHDLAALGAYETYREARSGRALQLVSPAAPVLAWEWEGGALAESARSG